MDCIPRQFLVWFVASRECREVATRWAIVPPGLPNTTGCFGSPFPFLLRGPQGMYLTYLDESGSPGDLNTPFFVLAGVSVFERQTHWLEHGSAR